MRAHTYAVRRVQVAVLSALLVTGVAGPAGASSGSGSGRAAEGVNIVSSQSNLLPASSSAPLSTSITGRQPPAGYRLYESHFYSYASCDRRGNWLKNVGHNIDNYWCSAKQSNGRHWLYVFGYCHTDVIVDGIIQSGKAV